jgi:hypothetical protein
MTQRALTNLHGTEHVELVVIRACGVGSVAAPQCATARIGLTSVLPERVSEYSTVGGLVS